MVHGGGEPVIAAELESSDSLPKAGFEPVVRAVALQVVHDLVASRVSRPVRRHGQPGQGGQGLRGVQMQPLVVVAPRLPDGVAGFQHLECLTRVLQASRRGEARRRCPDDQAVEHLRHPHMIKTRVTTGPWGLRL